MNLSQLLKDPALIVGLIRAGLILAVSFGVAFSQVQMDALLMFTGSLLAVMSVLLSAVTVRLTTPVAAPVLPQGTTVEIVTPEGQPNESVVL